MTNDEAASAARRDGLTDGNREEAPRYRHLSIAHLLGIMALFAAAWTIAGFATSFVLVGWYTAVQFCATSRARLRAVAVPFFLVILGAVIIFMWGLFKIGSTL